MIAAAHQSTNSGAPRRLRANRQPAKTRWKLNTANSNRNALAPSIASGNQEVRNITVIAMAYTRPNNMR